MPITCNTFRAFGAIQQVESDAIKAGLTTPNDILSVQQMFQWCVASIIQNLIDSCDDLNGIESAIIPLTSTYFRNVFFLSTYPKPSCDGGNYLDAFNAVAAAGGITYASAYPYNITKRKCDVTKNDYAVTVTAYKRVAAQQDMINYVLNGGTLVAVIDASGMGPYKSGIFSTCTSTYANHAVQIVGVNVDEGYWIIRNSWGSWWGDKGYMKLALVRS